MVTGTKRVSQQTRKENDTASTAELPPRHQSQIVVVVVMLLALLHRWLTTVTCFLTLVHVTIPLRHILIYHLY